MTFKKGTRGPNLSALISVPTNCDAIIGSDVVSSRYNHSHMADEVSWVPPRESCSLGVIYTPNKYNS